MGFSLILWPSWARLTLRKSVGETLQQTREFVDMVLLSLFEGDEQLTQINDLRFSLGAALEKHRLFFDEAKQESLLSIRMNSRQCAV